MKETLKEALVNKFGGGCLICGYNKCLAALHFHHINPHEKLFNISSKNYYWEIEKELEKCVLLCSVHHAEAHANLISPSTLQYLKDEM